MTKSPRFWPTPQARDTAKGDPNRVGRHGTKHGGRDLTDWVMVDHEAESASLQGDFLASHFPLPGSAEARQTTAISGRKCAELLSLSSLDTSLPRMCLDSQAWGSTRCYLTWGISDICPGSLIFRLQESVPPTDVTDSGLLPTPAATSYGTNQGGAAGRVGPVRPSLGTMARQGLWPTGDDLATAVARLIPTPQSKEYKIAGSWSNHGRRHR